MLRFLVILTVILGGVFAMAAANPGLIQSGDTPRPQLSLVAQAAPIDKSAEMQDDRKSLIEKLIREGVFQKVEMPGNLPRVWVRSQFYDLDFDLKQQFISVVFAYYFDGARPSDSVRIFDAKTNKEIGTFSEVSGGLVIF